MNTAQKIIEHTEKLLSGGGSRLLTIPIVSSSRSLIKDTECQSGWVDNHIKVLKGYYGVSKLPNFVQDYYSSIGDCTKYCDLLVRSLKFIVDDFGGNVNIMLSSEINDKENGGVSGLVDLIEKVGASEYISGETCLEYGLTQSELGNVRLLLNKWMPNYVLPYAPIIHYSMVGLDYKKFTRIIQ